MNYKPEHNVQIVIQRFNELQARTQCTDSYSAV